MPTIELIGVYPIKASEPVHLVELRVQGANGCLNFGGFTQEIPGKPRSNWQVPYLETILNTSGDKILADYFDASRRPELWQGDVRIAFFFHYLDFTRQLRTPFGQVQLPAESKLPGRLSVMEYEQP